MIFLFSRNMFGQKGGGKGMSQGSKKVDGKRSRWTRQERVRRQRLHVRDVGAHAFEVDDEEPFSENGCVHMSSIELNALEIASCVPQGKSQDLHWNRLMCVSAAVFPKKVAEDDPVLKTPGEAKSHRQARTPTVHRCPARRGRGWLISPHYVPQFHKTRTCSARETRDSQNPLTK